MREKRYYKDMKGTQGKEGESYPYFDIYSLEREVIKKIDMHSRHEIERQKTGKIVRE